MKGLIYKEAAGLLGLYKKSLLLVAVVYGAMSIVMENNFFLYFGIWMMGFYSLSGFFLDESSGWGRYARTLPVSDNDVVTAKFAAALIFVGIGAVYALAVAALRAMISGSGGLGEIVVPLVLVVSIAVAFTGLLLLLSVKFGADKARNYYCIFFLVAFLALFLLGKAGLLGGSYEAMVFLVWMGQNPLLLTVLCLGVAAVVFALCLIASCAIYRKKEF